MYELLYDGGGKKDGAIKGTINTKNFGSDCVGYFFRLYYGTFKGSSNTVFKDSYSTDSLPDKEQGGYVEYVWPLTDHYEAEIQTTGPDGNPYGNYLIVDFI